MGQEFTIKSSAIEDKINQLLPSQGGFQPGVDFSASTMVIPIVDLTETAEGGTTRQDLQTSLSHTSITTFDVNNATNTVLVTTTGYYRVFGVTGLFDASNATSFAELNLFDGTTSKPIFRNNVCQANNNNLNGVIPFDLLVLIKAGESLRATANASSIRINGCTRQIADLQGNLTNP